MPKYQEILSRSYDEYLIWITIFLETIDSLKRKLLSFVEQDKNESVKRMMFHEL